MPAQDPRVGLTLLLLDGTGGSESDLLPLGSALLPGAGLLSPRPTIVENGMPRFFRRFAEGVFDLEGFKVSDRRTGKLYRGWHKGGHELGQDDVNAATLWVKQRQSEWAAPKAKGNAP